MCICCQGELNRPHAHDEVACLNGLIPDCTPSLLGTSSLLPSSRSPVNRLSVIIPTLFKHCA